MAAFAGGDADEHETARARTIVERCSTCRDLYADLSAIALSVKAIPSAEATGTVRHAPRDFRITPQVAAQLRGGPSAVGLAQRIIEAIRSFGRPAGFALASFGLVGLLVGTVGLGPLAFEGAGGLGTTSDGQPAIAPEATFDNAGVIPLATSEFDGRQESIDMYVNAEVPWLVIVSGIVLVAGLGLLLASVQLRWERRSGP